MSSQANFDNISIDTMLIGCEIDNNYNIVASHTYTVHSSMSMLQADTIFNNTFTTIAAGAPRISKLTSLP